MSERSKRTVITRRQGQAIVVDGPCRIEVRRFTDHRVELAIDTPADVAVVREETRG